MSESRYIRRKMATLKKTQAKVTSEMQLLRMECPHNTPKYKYNGSTGNYDPSSDGYWIEWNCPDCEKHWTTDQGIDEIRRYPGAVQVTQ